MRTMGAFDGVDPEADRRKIFPELDQGGRPGAQGGDPSDAARGSHPKGELKATHIEADESDFGGPIKIQADKLPKRND